MACGVALVALFAMDYGKRQAWAYSVFRHDLLLQGLPLDDQEVNRMDRYVQFAVAAALEAVTDAGLDVESVDRERLAVTLGSAVGGTMVLERDYVVVSNHGEKWLVDHEYASPFLYHALVPSTLAAEVALKFGAQGPSVVVSTGCTSGIDGIGYGHQLIQDGEADIVISGASETGISPISMACSA